MPPTQPQDQDPGTQGAPVQPQRAFDPSSIYPTVSPNVPPSMAQQPPFPVANPPKRAGRGKIAVIVIASLIVLAGVIYYFFLSPTGLSNEDKAARMAASIPSGYKSPVDIYKPTFLPPDYYLNSVMTNADGVGLNYRRRADIDSSQKANNSISISQSTIKPGFSPPTVCKNTIVQNIASNPGFPCKEVSKTRSGDPIYRSVETVEELKGEFGKEFYATIGSTLIMTTLPMNDAASAADVIKMLESLTPATLDDIVHNSEYL